MNLHIDETGANGNLFSHCYRCGYWNNTTHGILCAIRHSLDILTSSSRLLHFSASRVFRSRSVGRAAARQSRDPGSADEKGVRCAVNNVCAFGASAVLTDDANSSALRHYATITTERVRTLSFTFQISKSRISLVNIGQKWTQPQKNCNKRFFDGFVFYCMSFVTLQKFTKI